MKKLAISAFGMLALLTSCTIMFIPASQRNITIHSEDPEAKVYVANELVGEGETVKVKKVRKQGFAPVTIVSPNKKTANYVMAPAKRTTAWYILMPLDVAAIYPMMFALGRNSRFWSYNKEYTFNNAKLNPTRNQNEKEIYYLGTKVKSSDFTKHFRTIKVKYHQHIFEEMAKAEEKEYAFDEKLDKRRNSPSTLTESKVIDMEDSKFSEGIIETLKKAKYLDTTGTVLRNKHNILGLESTIVGGTLFNIYSKAGSSVMYTIRFDIDWKFKNLFGQTLDSLRISEYSDFFVIPAYSSAYVKKEDNFATALQDAVNNSFYALYETKEFKKHIAITEHETVKEDTLELTRPVSVVQSAKDALKATVTIKLSDNKGHGSGFAITEDGYILTNYHVIAGQKSGFFDQFTVVMPDGAELKGQVVRSEPYNDIALVKVDTTFEKAFLLNDKKEYELLDEIYAVGTPVSAQLGSSLSMGVLSNERNYDGIDLLQLNIAISPGNSGGPMFSKQDGRLFGIISSKISGSRIEGIGFAIPSHLVKDYLKVYYK